MGIAFIWNSVVVFNTPIHIYTFFSCLLLNNVIAIYIGYGESAKSNLMVPMSRISSIFLMFIPIRKKITLWSIALQILNLLNIILYLAVYHFFSQQLILFEPKSRFIFTCSYIVVLAFLLADAVIFEIRNHK